MHVESTNVQYDFMDVGYLPAWSQSLPRPDPENFRDSGATRMNLQSQLKNPPIRCSLLPPLHIVCQLNSFFKYVIPFF